MFFIMSFLAFALDL